MNDLRLSLHNRPSVSPADKRRSRSRSPASPEAWHRPRNTEHSDYTYGAAVGKLRSMLRQHEPKPQGPRTVQFSPHVST